VPTKAYGRKGDDLERHIFCARCRTRTKSSSTGSCSTHIEKMTPHRLHAGRAQACQQFSHIYRRPRGLFVSWPSRAIRFRRSCATVPNSKVDVIVVTTANAILGESAIKARAASASRSAKLSLYSLIGESSERRCPSCSTSGRTRRRLADPEYLGWRHERIEGDGISISSIDSSGVRRASWHLPAVGRFRDAACRPILQRVPGRTADVQRRHPGDRSRRARSGLGRSGGDWTRPEAAASRHARRGVGSIGVARWVARGDDARGLSTQEARSRFWVIDKDGLLHSGRKDSRRTRPSMRSRRVGLGWPRTSGGNVGLAEVVGRAEASILIGLSTVGGGAFTGTIVREMARKSPRPIISPLESDSTGGENPRPAALDGGPRAGSDRIAFPR